MAAKGVVTDAAGNSYVTGSFAGTTSFGHLSLTSRGLTDLFLVKYNPAGKAVWATQIGRDPKTQAYSQPTASGVDVALDAAGNAYVIGNFTGTLSYGKSGTISSFSDGFNTALVAKFSSAGQVQWVERFGIAQFSCYGAAIATDAAGNSYVTGRSDYGGIQFGTQVVGSSRRVMYVARYTPTGAVAWAKVSSNYSSYGASGADVALDGRGNCLVGGGFTNDMVLDGTALTTTGSDAFLASFHAASGSLQWLRQGGGGSASSTAYISALATDGQGNVYAAGQHAGRTAFGGQPLSSNGDFDQLLARYTRTGALQWVYSGGTSAPEYSSCLVTTPEGTSTLIGRRLNSRNEATTIIQSIQPTGTAYYSETLGKTGSCITASIAQDKAGKLYLAGSLEGTASFGATTLRVPAGTAGFVGRLHLPEAKSHHRGGSHASVQVYPNPVQGRLVASLSGNKVGLLPGKALLHNSLGVVVDAQPLLLADVTQAQATFDCSSLPKGLYVLKLYSPDGTSYAQSVEVR
ncbi:hypothetical protein GCM10011378_01200 [Hymenobacter glacieicola]|uniref:Secretion system C-terminal sorting domain-containing protein n=2 Tax=Hymenobacter glacieicola TaxID=1562124 RepID=A0ABQ1WE99_9BACT|nr:hypothetical protein GCM10011378_01200 [Hymenobacter glacieicola]